MREKVFKKISSAIYTEDMIVQLNNVMIINNKKNTQNKKSLIILQYWLR